MPLNNRFFNWRNCFDLGIIRIKRRMTCPKPIGAHMTIRDTEKMMAYAVAASIAVDAHGGNFLARGGRVATLEGFEQSRVVIVEYPNLEQAVACYNSDDYKSAQAILGDGAARDICVVEALD